MISNYHLTRPYLHESASQHFQFRYDDCATTMSVKPLWAGGKTITVAGGQLEATWFGPPPSEAPTLVFLHEGLGCISMWKDTPRKLAAATGCGALVYTRFGYANSDPCSLPRQVDYMHGEAHEVLPQVLSLLGVQQCILIGHSDGGSIAILHLGSNPSVSVRGAITLGAHVFVEDLTVAAIAATKDQYRNGDLKRGLAKHHGEHTDRVFWSWNDIWLLPEFKNWNIETYLADITLPMLVIQGEQDPYGSEAQIDAIVAGTTSKVETLMIPDCEHWPHLEQPDLTLRAMAQFIQHTLIV